MKKAAEYREKVNELWRDFDWKGIITAKKLDEGIESLFDEAQKDAYNQALIDAGMLGKVELVLVKSGEHPIYEYRIEWESLKKLMK